MAIKVQIIVEDKLLAIVTVGAFNIFLSSQIGSQALANSVDKKIDVILLQCYTDYDVVIQFVGRSRYRGEK